MRRSTMDDRRKALEAADMLLRVGRDLPKLRAVLVENRADGLRAAAYDGVIANGGEPSDPTMRMALAFVENDAHDEALTDLKSLELALDEADRAIKRAYRLHARWLPWLSHVDACANPHGCPDERPAAKGRRGLCTACFSWQHAHPDQPHRRESRVRAVAM